jgi:hypothetical protein
MARLVMVSVGDGMQAEKMALLVKVLIGDGPFFHLAATKGPIGDGNCL